MSFDSEPGSFGLMRGKRMKPWTERWLQMRSPVFGVLRLRNRLNNVIMVLNNLHCVKISENVYATNGPHVDIRSSILGKTLQPQSPSALGFPVPPHGEAGAHHLRQVQTPLVNGLNKGTVL